ncbi:MAG: helix-turn-helix transcriptional regulator [Chloroflexi bacterium]|nr:helix-turn-helix transcriptional regulator [Chloroflexota bacterium]
MSASDSLPPPGAEPVASARDARGIPVHRGWAPLGGLGITGGAVDVGQVYRTLRDLEAGGQVTSSWSNEPVGPQRRDYELTEAGYAALDEWAAVMKERARLVAEFDARYLEWVARPRRAGSTRRGADT